MKQAKACDEAIKLLEEKKTYTAHSLEKTMFEFEERQVALKKAKSELDTLKSSLTSLLKANPWIEDAMHEDHDTADIQDLKRHISVMQEQVEKHKRRINVNVMDMIDRYHVFFFI